MTQSDYTLSLYDIQLEQAVLGVMLRGDILLNGQLQAGDFHDLRHQAIFIACKKLEKATIEADIVTVSHQLEQDGKLSEIGLEALGWLYPAARRAIQAPGGHVLVE